jgi:hypothetical protein
VISATAPVALFGGSPCTYVPYNQVACDHVEEQMLPYRTWGRTHVGVKSHAYAGATSAYPDFWRLASACGLSCPGGVNVTLTPAVASFRADPNHATSVTCTTSGSSTTCHLPPTSLGGSAPWVEFQHGSSFLASADQPVSLAQYFVSESEAGGQGVVTEGDPSLVVAPPVEQWQAQYQVLAPAAYAHNYLNLMVQGQAATGAVQVDGANLPASEWASVPGTNYYAAVHSLCGGLVAGSDAGCSSSHAISGGGNPVGVVVYGYDSYVSYGYTGGLTLAPLNSGGPGQ